jgi:hypothetical protein
MLHDLFKKMVSIRGKSCFDQLIYKTNCFKSSLDAEKVLLKTTPTWKAKQLALATAKCQFAGQALTFAR